MNLFKNFPFRGLDLRSNKLTRAGNTASDCRDVWLDSNRRLKNRPRFEETNLTNLGLTGEIVDTMTYGYAEEIIILTRENPVDGLYTIKVWRYLPDVSSLERIKLNAGQYSTITTEIEEWFLQGTGASFSPNVEIDGVLYFLVDDTTKERAERGSNLYKYDGKYASMAGLPKYIYDDANFNNGSRRARVFYFTYDEKFNFIRGQHKDNSTSDTNILLNRRFNDFGTNIPPRYNCAAVGVDRNMGTVNSAQHLGVEALQLTTNILYVNCSIGDTVQYITPVATATIEGEEITRRFIYRYEILDIDDTDPNNVDVWLNVETSEIMNNDTLEWESRGVSSDSLPIPDETIMSSLFMAVYISTNGVTWTFDQVSTVINQRLNFNFDFLLTTSPSSALEPVSYYPMFPDLTSNFDNGFDESAFAGLPPYATDLANYNQTLLLIDERSAHISDGLSQGSSIENFRGGNQSFTVGTSKDGQLKGIFANENFIAVFREREAYYVVGDVFNNNFRIQSYYSTEIGCTAPTGIVEMAGYCFFPSERGFYFARQGASMDELSDVIEPMFTDNELSLDLDMSNCRAFVDFWREYILIYIKSTSGTGKVLAYSYYWKDWFIWDLQCDQGLITYGKRLFYSRGTSIYEEKDSAKEKIKGYWSSNFETLGEPSLKKQFTKITVSSLNDTEFDLNIKTEEDWKEGDFSTDQEKAFDGDKNMVRDQRFDSDRNFSRRITLEFNSKKDVIIDGYEYEFRMIQDKRKADGE